MTKLLTAMALAAMALTAVPAAAEMRLVLDDETRVWVDAPAPSGINLILDDETRIITRGPQVRTAMDVATTTGECSQIEASLGFSSGECGVTPKADLARMVIDQHD